MKRLTIAVGMGIVCFWAASVFAAYPFTYQGRLYDNGTPADGEYSLTFMLMNTSKPTSEGRISESLWFRHTQISDGYFTVLLDFEPCSPNTEADLFDGSDRWLYISACPSDSTDPNDFSELLPMPKITAAPYAHVSHQLQTPATLRSETIEPTLTIDNTGDGPALYFEDPAGSVEYGYDADTNVANDLTVHVGNSQSIAIDADSTEVIGHNRILTVSGGETKTIGVNLDETIAAARTTLIGAQDNTTVGGSSTTSVGSHRIMDISGNSTETVGKSRTISVGADSTTTAGTNMQAVAGDTLSLFAENAVRLQNGMKVFRDPNNVLEIDGAITMQPVTDIPPAPAGSGKVFVNAADGKLYYIDTTGALHNLVAALTDRVSFSIKRNASYTWPTGTTFETVDFSSESTEWDNTGGGFNGKNSTFIAPADGLYTFSGSIFFTDLSKGDLIAAAINAAGKRYRGDAKTASGESESVRAVVTVYLHADDTVTLEGYVSTAAPPVTVHGAASGIDAFTWFNGARVD